MLSEYQSHRLWLSIDITTTFALFFRRNVLDIRRGSPDIHSPRPSRDPAQPWLGRLAVLNRSLAEILILIPVILVSLTIHELAHAWVSLMLGDDTAKQAGRITLNPLRHVDPIGFLMLVVVGFGWAKPVTFDRRKLGSPVRDEILVSFAGPVSNILLALLGAVALRLIVSSDALSTGGAYEAVLQVGVIFCVINIALGVFNALPVPPLDGSHLYLSILTEKNPKAADTVSKYGVGVLLAIIITDRVTGIDLLPIGSAIDAVFRGVFGLVGLTV
jgi:Zn-dependent protease